MERQYTVVSQPLLSPHKPPLAVGNRANLLLTLFKSLAGALTGPYTPSTSWGRLFSCVILCLFWA